MNSKIVIFTDGASRGNPGPGGFGAVVVINEKVQEIGGREDMTTNNRMELMAAIEGLGFVSKNTGAAFTPEKISLYSDSRYVINGITKWVFGWVKNGWKTGAKEDVVNRELWEALMLVRQELGSKGMTVEWNYVGGHRGIVGNERCDEIATAFADKKQIGLYSGALADYGLDVLNIQMNDAKSAATSASKSRKGAKAYSYLSLLDGKVERHTSWPECEARVKGKSGVKFKKALSAEDEQQILKEWGVE